VAKAFTPRTVERLRLGIQRTDAPAWRENLMLRGLTALPLST
jgi:hypothetical protein